MPERALAGSPAERRGAAAEGCVCAHLQRQGQQFVARNVIVRWRVGAAAASIDRAKHGRIRLAAQAFLFGRFHDRWPICRFGVVLAERGDVQWVRSAFSAEED